MSFFSTFGKPGAPKSKAPVIRKETRVVTKPTPPQTNNGPKPPLRPASSSPALRINGHSRSSPLPVKTSKLSGDKQKRREGRLAPPMRPAKRKSASPSVQFGSMSEGDSDEEIDLDRRKKAKTDKSPSPDYERAVRDVHNWAEIEDTRKIFPLEHSVNITSGSYTKDYEAIFTQSESADVELQYPSASQREKFRIVSPRESDGYDPLTDLIQTITSVVTHYLPTEQAQEHLDSSTGIPWLLHRACKNDDLASFKQTLDKYNILIDTSLSSGIIATNIDGIPPRLPLPLVERILTQIYSRIVSPRVDILRRYTVGSDNVYGELLPAFCSQVFKDSRLDAHSVFLDLGSGVGNVVLQAALEIGCESWGVETMPNACELAQLQAAEFPARARMWGLAVGSVNLLQGDFLQDPRVGAVLRRAEVVLVNNQAFQPDTNGKIVDLLLDLKEGARVVSLKSFVPSGFKLTPRTCGSPCATLKVVRKDFWRDWVSWTNAAGEYYVATKDSGRIQRILGNSI